MFSFGRLHESVTRVKKLAVAGLDLLWGGLLAGGYLFGKPEPPRQSRFSPVVELLSSAVLTGAAWTLRSAAPKGPLRRFATRMAWGMSFGFAGDVCMKFSVPAGMATFGIGHAAYIFAMLGLGRELGNTAALRRFGAWAAWIAIGLAAWYLIVRSGPQGRSPLAWAGLGYCLLLSSTAGVALGLFLQRPRYLPVFVGAALFVASDVILAMRIFNRPLFEQIPESIRGDIVWLTYGPAQAILVNSVLLALSDPAFAKTESVC